MAKDIVARALALDKSGGGGEPSDTVYDGKLTIKVNGEIIGTFTANSANPSTVDIIVPTDASDVNALPDTTKYASGIFLTIDSTTYVVTAQLKDQNGDNIGAAQTIDLPLESVVVSGAYDDATKKVILTLQNGSTIDFSVADLVSGLQTELSDSNKLNPAFINYDSTHRAVSDAEKSTWNNKQDSLTTAQLAAVNSGITVERLETIDTTLSDKVDKETGKGLSTNDFTNTDKANLTTALTKANAAAPQETTYTKDEVDAAIEEAIEHGGGGTTDYTDLTNKPSINGVVLTGNKTTSDLGIEENVQANWTQTDTTADDYIKNKPTIPAPVTVDQTYSATSSNAQSGVAVAQAISTKVDKVTGKGLSTNDFTNADKTNLETALTKANSAAPQSTTYTKTEVDAALAAKINASDVDSALSSTSKNPVQNKAVQAPVARLVDAGAKNLLKITATTQTINGVTFTVNADQTVTLNGTNTGTSTAAFVIVPNRQAILIPDGDYWLSGCPQGGDDGTFDLRWFRYSPNASAYDRGSGVAIHKSGNTAESNIEIVVKSGVTVNNITFKPMLCTAEDYAISQEFVPYAPSNRKLYEQNVEQDVYFQGNVTNFDTAIKIPLGSAKYGDASHSRYKVGLIVTNPNGSTANLYYIAISTDNSVTVNKMFGEATTTFTGSYDGSNLTLTPSTKMWGGVRIIWLD